MSTASGAGSVRRAFPWGPACQFGPGLAAVPVVAMPLAGCAGQQSVLDPAGTEAEQVASLFHVMLAGSIVIWIAVIALALYAQFMKPERYERRVATALIIGGGAVFPTIVLAGLLGYGLVMMREMRAPADPDGVRLHVEGEMWWWRVTYHLPDGRMVESANEVRLPNGRRTAIDLSSLGVIHSFWVPALGGKMDLIPGRTNRLVLEPTRAGTYRGQCAEFCGTAHAMMAFTAVVMEPEAFEAWLAHAASPAEPPRERRAERGREIFLSTGCGACHRVRGLAGAVGGVGPDLTHIAGRATIGAGTLPNTPEAMARWIGHTGRLKPEVRMPAFDMLPEQDLGALAAYLGGLR